MPGLRNAWTPFSAPAKTSMPEFAGLRTDFNTWMIMGGMTLCWLASVRLVPDWRRDGWTALLKSLYGIVWLGFGLDIVLRFSMLAYNAVEWGNDTARLVALPLEVVDRTLMYCGLFWVSVSVGYAIAVRRRTAGPLRLTQAFNLELVYALLVPGSLASAVLYYVVDRPNIPLKLVTPLADLAALYLVPAAVVWWDHFRHPGPKWRIGSLQILALLPALVHGVLSPYRENLVPLFLLPLIGALFAGRRPRLWKLLPAALLCFVLLSTVVASYRRLKWESARPEEVAIEMREASLSEWLVGDWGERLKRFHSFDSMLVTVGLVPGARPHSGRNVLLRPFFRAFVPRFVYGEKGEADAAARFGATIWAYNDPKARDHGGAAIAPSMPGDLYDAGGVLYIVLGALLWGALLGLVDGWKSHLPRFCGAAITALVATHCAMSIERDFDHTVAGFIQIFLLMLLVAGVIALARQPEPRHERPQHARSWSSVGQGLERS